MKTFKRNTVTCNLTNKPFRVYRINKYLLFIKAGILPDTDQLFLTDSKGYTYKRNLQLQYICNTINWYFTLI